MSSQDKTLIILTPGFPGNEDDSTCLPLHQSFVYTLKKEYPDISVIILSFQYPYFQRSYTWLNTPVISFNGKNRGGIYKQLLRKKILRTIKEFYQPSGNTALLSFWYGECAFVGEEFARKNNLKHFCWLQGQDAKSDNPYPSKVKLKSSRIIALSDFLQDEFKKNHRTRPQYVIPPGIDTQRFSDQKKEKIIDILGTGSLILLKQYDIFLKVIAEIRNEFPAIKVVLTGTGPQREKLEKMIFELELEKNVTLTGQLPYAEVLKTMQQAKVFLHTSCYEGFGMVCLEALYAGARVISFNKPMGTPINNWDIVDSDEDMINRAIEILRDYRSPSGKILPFTIQETVSKMMKLSFE